MQVIEAMNAPTPNLRARIWNLLRTARSVGQKGVAVSVLASVLSMSPETVLEAVLPDMVETAYGQEHPPIYCDPSGMEPVLVARRFQG